MIVGAGVDIVPLERFTAQESPGEFFRQVLTDEEMARGAGGPGQAVSRACTFAVKEALLKALSCGLQEGFRWHDIVVDGANHVQLSGPIRRLAEQQSVSAIHVSYSSSDTFAVAFVVLETNNPG